MDVETGERVAFGVAYTPARAFRAARDGDSGEGLANVRVLLTRGVLHQVIATTESDGSFATAAAPGEWQVSLLSDSVPAGFSLSGTEAREVMLERSRPQDASWTLARAPDCHWCGAARTQRST